ncbi:MAG: hypothetical protein LIO53_09120 [Oscillospiraceae bacterium]|nr:hypothetical protein [Oscillospiraceae bacterium]
MKKEFLVTERSFGHIEIDVPDNASDDEMLNTVHEEYVKGNIYWFDSNLDEVNNKTDNRIYSL